MIQTDEETIKKAIQIAIKNGRMGLTLFKEGSINDILFDHFFRKALKGKLNPYGKGIREMEKIAQCAISEDRIKYLREVLLSLNESK